MTPMTDPILSRVKRGMITVGGLDRDICIFGNLGVTLEECWVSGISVDTIREGCRSCRICQKYAFSVLRGVEL